MNRRSRYRRPVLTPNQQARAFGGLGRLGRFGEAPTSFTSPDQTCSVESIEAAGGNTWRSYCDCMFLDGHGKHIRYWYDGVEITGLLMVRAQQQYGASGLTDDHAEQILKSEPAWSDPTKRKLLIEQAVTRTPDWYKCVSNWCGNANGCYDDDLGFTHPYNVSVGIGTPPWTDFGAAARGIPKRNAGFWYDFANALKIDPSDYDPVKAWKTMWTNPTLHTVQMAKASLFGLGAVSALYTPSPQFFLLVNEEVARRQLDWVQNVFMPVWKGGTTFVGLLFQWMQSGFGWANLAGIVTQQAAQDQIDSGEINKINSPEVRAFIVFLSKHAREFVSEALNAADGLRNGAILGSLSAMFDTVARAKDIGLPEILYDFFAVCSVAFRAAQIIQEGIARSQPASTIADRVMMEMLGFSPSQYNAVLKASGPVAAKALVDQANSTGKGPAATKKLLAAIATAFPAVLEGLRTIKKVVAVLDPSQNTANQLQQIISSAEASLSSLGSTTSFLDQLATSLSTATTTASRTIPRGATITSVASKPKVTPAGQNSGGGALVTIAAGAAIGGVPGALVGLLIGSTLK